MSASSYLLSNLTSFRNPNGPEQEWTQVGNRNHANPLKVIAAEFGGILFNSMSQQKTVEKNPQPVQDNTVIDCQVLSEVV